MLPTPPSLPPPGETGGNRIHLPLRDREILGLLPTTAPGITVREIIELGGFKEGTVHSRTHSLFHAGYINREKTGRITRYWRKA